MSNNTRLPRASIRCHGVFALAVGVLAIFSLLALERPAEAIPATPNVLTLTQPDGTTLRARLRGDEWQHWMETLDGRIIEQDANGEWVTKGIAPPPLNRSRRDRAMAVGGPQRAVPSLGAAHLPVLCANFSDTSTSYTAGDFDSLLFQGSASMSAHYAEGSYGKFSVDGAPSGVGGWYTAAQNHDYYGTNDAAGNDEYAATLVIEAVNAADAAGYDFGGYDADNDGYVDVVAIVHQGTDEAAGGPSTDIWSHSWNLASAQINGDGSGPVTTSSGKIVNSYIIQPEHQLNGDIETIGVYCHEYGHALGMPDFYDYTSRSSGLGRWSVMAGGGSNGNSGDMPAHMDAWCKVQLGWVAPTVATTSIIGAPAPQVLDNEVIYQVFAGASTTEYYLIENRQQVGFDAALPGAGLLIYHVDDTQTSNDNPWYPGNTNWGNYRVALEQADGLWELDQSPFAAGDVGDPYPGSTGNRAYDDTSTPTATLYDDSLFPLVVRNISASGANMTLDIVDTQAPLAPRSISAFDTPGDEGGSVTVSWSRSQDDGRGADDVVAYDVLRTLDPQTTFTTVATTAAGETAYLDTNVTDNTSYWYKVIVRDGAGLTAETSVAGPAVPRDDLKPPAVDNLIVRDTQADDGRSMTLSWVGYQAPADLEGFNVYRSEEPFTSTGGDGVVKLPPTGQLVGNTVTDPNKRIFIDAAADPDADPDTAAAKPLDLTDYYYAVAGYDEVDNEITAVTPVGPVQCAPNLSLTYLGGLQFISIPALPVDPSPMSVLGLNDPSDAEFARYDTVNNIYHALSQNPDDPFIEVRPGVGFWLERIFPTYIAVAGMSVEDDEFAVPLEIGWNPVGSPYDADYGLEEVDVRDPLGTVEDLPASNHVRTYGWFYDDFERSYKLLSRTLPNASLMLPARRAMWIYCFDPGTELVFYNNVSTASAALAADPVELDGWQIQLIAATDEASDTDNFIGVTPAATSIGKVTSPPLAAGGVDLYFTDGGVGRVAMDYVKSLAPGTVWTAAVESAVPGKTVTLTWPDLSEVPNDVRPVLTDLQTGRSAYMRTVTSYSFVAREGDEPREFEVSFADPAAGPVLTQAATAPNRLGGAEVSFRLMRAADVAVTVRNLAGRVVSKVPVGAGEVGLNRATWDGRSSRGLAVPAGRYVVEITATALDNGEKASLLGSVLIAR